MAAQHTRAVVGARIKTAAQTTYKELTNEGRSIPLHKEYSQALANQVRSTIDEAGAPRELLAKKAHKKIDSIENATDVGSLIDTRKALAKVARTKNDENLPAALAAIKTLDETIEQLSPGAVAQLKDADKNWAIFRSSSKVETQLTDALAKERDRTLAGNRIRKAFKPLLEKDRAKYMSEPLVRLSSERHGHTWA